MDVIVIGAGVSGSLAAAALAANGDHVVVLDKGFVPGGRLATRHVGDATFDVGAQFLTARSEPFRGLVRAWEAAGVLQPWFRGSPDLDADPDPDGHQRWRGSPTMRTLATHLVAGLDLRLGTIVTSARVQDGAWEVEFVARRAGDPSRPGSVSSDAPRSRQRADLLVVTAPVPQALALLDAGAASLPTAVADRLRRVTYDPCLTLLAVPHGPVNLPEPGAVRIEDGTLAWVSDHHRSGASGTPAITVHAAAAFSRDHLDASEATITAELTRAARDLLGTELDPVHLHRWRYATPLGELGTFTRTDRTGRGAVAAAAMEGTAGPGSLVVDIDGAPLALAGDAFLGGRIEGAALSGLAAAEQLLAARLDPSAR